MALKLETILTNHDLSGDALHDKAAAGYSAAFKANLYLQFPVAWHNRRVSHQSDATVYRVLLPSARSQRGQTLPLAG